MSSRCQTPGFTGLPLPCQARSVRCQHHQECLVTILWCSRPCSGGFDEYALRSEFLEGHSRPRAGIPIDGVGTTGPPGRRFLKPMTRSRSEYPAGMHHRDLTSEYGHPARPLHPQSGTSKAVGWCCHLTKRTVTRVFNHNRHAGVNIGNQKYPRCLIARLGNAANKAFIGNYGLTFGNPVTNPAEIITLCA